MRDDGVGLNWKRREGDGFGRGGIGVCLEHMLNFQGVSWASRLVIVSWKQEANTSSKYEQISKVSRFTHQCAKDGTYFTCQSGEHPGRRGGSSGPEGV